MSLFTPSSFRTNRRYLITLLSIVVSLYWVSMYTYAPTLPNYAQTKTDNLTLVGTILAQYGLWQAIVRLPLGIFADWIGRRKPLIITGILLAACGALLMASAGDFSGMIIGRAITGIGAGTWVLLVVAFSSLFPPEDAVRASVLLSFINAASRMAATSSTGFLNKLGGYPLAFYIAAATAVIAVLCILPYQETRRARKSPDAHSILRLITRKDVLLPAVLSALAQYISWSSTYGFVPILARQLGANDFHLSALTSLNIGLIMAANLLTSFAIKRVSSKTQIVISFVLLSVGLALNFWVPSLTWIFISASIIGFAGGISYPILMGLSIRKVNEEERATAMGLHQAVYATGMFAGPWLSGILSDQMGIRNMFAITAIGFLILGMIGCSFLDPDRPNPAANAQK